MQTILLRVIYVDNAYNSRWFLLLSPPFKMISFVNEIWNVIHNNFLENLDIILLLTSTFNIGRSSAFKLVTFIIFSLSFIQSTVFFRLCAFTNLKQQIIKITNNFFLITLRLLWRGKNLVGRNEISRKSSRVNPLFLAESLSQLSHYAASYNTGG